MNDESIVDIWMLFKNYLAPKDIEAAAEKYVDAVLNHGATELDLDCARGACPVLDQIIEEHVDDEAEG